MTIIAIVTGLLCISVIGTVTIRLQRAKRDLEAKSIEPEELYAFAEHQESAAV